LAQVAEQLSHQKVKVQKLSQDFARVTDEVENRKARMDALRDQWLPALQELADKISVKFERLFDKVNCEGIVTLVKGTDGIEDDYENYGLSIRVSFRAGQELQELGSTQSGGERSVSTAIYLMALQELTDVPFRCMDEINQV
jgi:structural maintenance of chromosomes protein 5